MRGLCGVRTTQTRMVTVHYDEHLATTETNRKREGGQRDQDCNTLDSKRPGGRALARGGNATKEHPT